MAGARRGEQLLHHRQGARVVFDHAFEEEAIELFSLGGGQSGHLLGSEHARHHRRAGHVMRMFARNFLAPGREPLAHHVDLVFLGHGNPQREFLHVLARGARWQQRRHVDCLGVMVNHALHELDVRWCELNLRQVSRLLGLDDAARLSRGARLDDLRRLVAAAGAAGRTNGKAKKNHGNTGN